MNNLLMVYITVKNKEQAKKIAEHLIEKKLIACANIFPINNYFEWEKNINEENEFVVVCKSIPALQVAIEEEVKRIHTYNVPCVISWHVKANTTFSSWVFDEVKH